MKYMIIQKKYIDQPSDGYNNMKRGDAFYKRMLELVEYFQKMFYNIYCNWYRYICM